MVDFSQSAYLSHHRSFLLSHSHVFFADTNLLSVPHVHTTFTFLGYGLAAPTV